MPPYEARRPAGSFRSSLRSNPRYDEREPLDDGDSGPGSDVTESEWGFEARHLRATPVEPAEAPRRRVGGARARARRGRARAQYPAGGGRYPLPQEEELTGWALTKKCVSATCVERAEIHLFSTRTDDPTGILK